MKRSQIQIGKIKGIPVGLDYSWFLVFILVTWILAASYFPAQYKGWSAMAYWITGSITSVLFFGSVLLHELAHSVFAVKYDIKVRRITLFVFGGIAEITEEPKKPSQEFWIALAGPLMSFLIAFISYFISKEFSQYPKISAVFEYLFEINFILAIFNLVPGFPLDGGRVFRAVVWAFTKNFQKATSIAAVVGRFFGFLFILYGFMLMMKGSVVDGIWIAFIGWFLESAALAQVQRQVVSKLLAGHKVADAMSRSYALLPSDTTIQDFIQNNMLFKNRRFFIVEENGENIGFFTIHSMNEVPKEKWDTVTVKEIMTPISEMKKTTPDFPLLEALKEMDKDGVNQLPVYEDGKIIGILSRENIITYLHTMHLNS